MLSAAGVEVNLSFVSVAAGSIHHIGFGMPDSGYYYEVGLWDLDADTLMFQSSVLANSGDSSSGKFSYATPVSNNPLGSQYNVFSLVSGAHGMKGSQTPVNAYPFTEGNITVTSCLVYTFNSVPVGPQDLIFWTGPLAVSVQNMVGYVDVGVVY